MLPRSHRFDALRELATRDIDALPPANCHWAVRAAMSYLAQHIEEPVSLDELARFTRITKFHLTRCFKEALGVPPHMFHMHLRVRHAAKLMVAGESATTAAQHSGFTDQSHLTRWFRRVYGVTPRQYMREQRLTGAFDPPDALGGRLAVEPRSDRQPDALRPETSVDAPNES